MIYTFPLIGAFLGWFTNYIAIKMLFYPRKEIAFLGLRIQGVFPKRQEDIANNLGKIVSNELLSVQDLKEKLVKKENFFSLREKVSSNLDLYLDNELPRNYPLISFFMGSRTKGRIRESFLCQFEIHAPALVGSYIDNIKDGIDIESIVRQKVSSLSTSKLEILLNQVIKRELKFVEICGGILGFLIGSVQMFLTIKFVG